MVFLETAIGLGERLNWPDALTRAVIHLLVARTARKLRLAGASADRAFADAMAAYPIAQHTADANAQHYEVPDDFFALILGPQRKYSSCLYRNASTTLAEAEEFALVATAAHADLADGQTILELGCGWGSLSLFMALTYPASRITAVSNSQSQRAFVTARAQAMGLPNLRVVTADMNDFAPGATFDRIVSVEMFEHMANWRALLARAAAWLNPQGRLFLHVFTHRAAPYRFDTADKTDWIAQNFFTGGIMPSHALVRQFADLFAVESEWRWSGTHYARTAQDWLANFDRNVTEIDRVLDRVYGADAALWRRRWRLFFLATSGLFGHVGGREWGVSHYRLKPARP